MQYLITLFIIALLAAAVIYLFIRGGRTSASHSAVLAQLAEEKARHDKTLLQAEHIAGQLTRAEGEKARLSADYARLQENYNSLQAEAAEQFNRLTLAEERLQRNAHDLEEQAKRMSDMQAQLEQSFKLITADALKHNTEELTQANKASLGALIAPLKENIERFEKKVQDVYDADLRDRQSLKGSINEILKQSQQLGTEAQNLTRALKGDTKKQGTWGEIILERVLESSGLRRDAEYRVQQSVATEGARLQPDVIINLPDDKHLVIDSKVSLLAYEKAVASETEEERQLHLKNHTASIRKHVQSLSGKEYFNLQGVNSPDFVLLFVPVEAGFSAAIQHEAELFAYAWERKVVIVSPTTLLATLRTIASVWQYNRQSKNVMEIADRGGKLYDKFCLLLQDMEALGKTINNSSEAFNKAMTKLATGSGSLTGQVEKLKALGAKAVKQIDAKHLPGDYD